MKKIFSILFLMAVILAKPVYSKQMSEYKLVPIKDKKTDIEIAGTIIPKEFDAESKIVWERNHKEPLQLHLYVKSKDEKACFSYSSAKTYADTLSSDSFYKSEKEDLLHNISVKKFVTPKDYIFEELKGQDIDNTEIKLNSETEFSQDLKDYLTEKLYQRINELEVDAKSDKKASKVVISNPRVLPYIAEYSYKNKDKSYKHLFVTMFTVIDYHYTNKSTYDEYTNTDKTIWRNNGLYSFKAEESVYDEYLDDFVMFVTDSMINQKAKEALERTKTQMIIEAAPTYRSIYNERVLKKLPSEQFRLFYEGGAADYSEDKSAQIPVLDEVRWLSEYIIPQNCFYYRKMTNLWRQRLYVPKKYEYVYYNSKEGTFIISTKRLKSKYKRLKLKAEHT